MSQHASKLHLLDIDKCVTTRLLFCNHSPRVVSHPKFCLSLSPVICLSSFTSDLFLALCPVTIFLSAIPLTFCISYQMFLTSHIRKHVCPYISENNFGSSKQIIVPTGYRVFCGVLPCVWGYISLCFKGL